MKLFWFTLSFYLVTLSVFPCNDIMNDNQKSITINLEDHGHQELDLCSPFCICSCCGINTYQFKLINYNITEQTVFIQQIKQNNFYVFIYSKDVTSSIWQPPQIV